MNLLTHEEKEFYKEQREIALENIERLKEELKHPLISGMETKIVKNAALRRNYALIDDTKNEIACCEEIVKVFRTNQMRYRQLTQSKQLSMYNHYYDANLVLARHDFHYFLLCMEWGQSAESKFYENRFIVFKDWTEELEKLENGKYDILGLSAPPRSGKAQPLYSRILTPNGWTTMGNIKPGSVVIGADGKPCDVLEVFPQGVKDIYRVTFDDNTYVDCSGDHLWTVQTRDDRRNRKNRTVATVDMLKNIYVEKGKRKNYSINYVQPIEFNSKLSQNDLNPYLVGALLGDGNLRKHSIRFSSKDSDIIAKIKGLLPKSDTIYSCSVGENDRYDYVITKKDKSIRNENGYMVKPTTQQKLVEYGLCGCRSEDKFIPKKYLYGTVNERLELLRGLMDTDGYAGSKNTSMCEFTSVSMQLRDDVAELARSLGARVVLTEKDTFYKKDGKKINCQKAFRAFISIEINPFYCKRKVDRFTPRSQRNVKYISSIDYIGKEECQCILVDHPQHLYVTDGYNLTHNTGIGTLFLLWVMSRHPDKSCLFVSHTTAMAKKVYDDLLRMIGVNDKKQGISNYFKIFPEMQIEKSAEYLWIDLSPKKSANIYKTFYGKGIDGSMAGVLEASHLLYCDDLISGIEEALNPTRLDTAWTKYSTDVIQRRKDSTVKELHIATRWSTQDPISKLEEMNENNPRAKFIKVPGLNEDGKSNFNFKHNPLDEKHFNYLKSLYDEVSFECIIQQNPVEREGLIFPKKELKYYEGILPGEADQIASACDVAWGGGDYLSMPVCYVYEDSKEIYVHDVVHSPATKDITKPKVINKIIEHSITRGHFEANNGGDEYAEDIERGLKERNYRCAITHKKAPSNRTKLDRIVSCSSEIKGIIEDKSGYKIYFLSAKAREGNKEYEMFMKHLTNFNQSAKFVGKQKDDAADALSSFITNVLSGSRTGRMNSYPGSLLGL